LRDRSEQRGPSVGGRGEGDQALLILKEMLHENSKDGVLDAIASMIKKHDASQNFLKVSQD
jgi:hypothetical protein